MFFIWKVFDRKPSGRPRKHWSHQEVINGQAYEKILIATKSGDLSHSAVEKELAMMKKAFPDPNYFYIEDTKKKKVD